MISVDVILEDKRWSKKIKKPSLFFSKLLKLFQKKYSFSNKKANLRTPSFDIVRITPQGDTVMAGRARPGAKVEIYDGRTKIGEVTADKRGEWVFVPTSPLAPGSRKLSLKMIKF
jgi:hypothetical protein